MRRPAPTDAPAAAPGPRRWPWAQLLRRVFAIQVLVCPRCSGPRRILGAVTEPHAVRRLLGALGLAAAPFRHRLVTRRRSRRPPPAATVALIVDTCGARATASTSEEKQSVRTAVRRGRSGRRPWSARPGRPSMPQGGGAAGHRKAPADQPACPPPGCPGGLRRTTCTPQPT